jgi:hypothetical protein
VIESGAAMLEAAGDVSHPRTHELRARLGRAIAARVSPERTRRATRLERMTVSRLSWNALVRLNRWLEVTGKLATVVWVGFIASIVLGLDVKDYVRHALNSGAPLASAAALAIIVPTVVFLVARSSIGFARWRLQRELWRRDVLRLERDP